MKSIIDDFGFYVQRFLVVGVLVLGVSFLLTLLTDPRYLIRYMKFSGLVLCIIGFLGASGSSSNQSHTLTGSTNSYHGPISGSASNHAPRLNVTGSADFDSGLPSYLVYGGGLVFLSTFIFDLFFDISILL